MAENESSDQRKRKAGEKADSWSDISKLVITVGFGAAVTGMFSVWGILLTEARKVDEQRCSVAQQIVVDESPSPALNEAQRRRLGLLATRTLEQCLGEAA
jgi:hypothetical protein